MGIHSLLSTQTGVLDLAFMLIVFIIVLALAYYASKFISVQNSSLQRKKNLKVIESVQIAPHKMIQLIQVGNKYYAIAVTKDNITKIDEIDENEIDLTEISHKEVSFKRLLHNMTKEHNQEVVGNEDNKE
ncbi:flagellar biosynthetic protein FliO [Vallitalea okinawensis]|uniref:flagellar biosynthetic protein FliO n=1 Tax=Vallitalea okinawensis TaxID=2078660 RepID=UPI000CFC9EA9|nr:flagellar biosynthetic protein FliO [Vallitalea okinawensis]